ncbi:long-chain fatty acid transporter [Legionella birminghamensis]|uniref:Long-chain fatty acid transporter n=1 Tax=Legionella birminghamensis TaxID=28083 RepID=A0A378IBY5_9GAMM|nr:outer membrane protein transport protein [Legionella birminghamensis]KTC75501.1 long-chain fatty acid transporter [Legionella birminghamensis]STX32727.1 long-chain fatty acid transporter [Legionella birminghamensis]
MQKSQKLLLLGLLAPLELHASFIESTLGAAVVNDATASYYNPAALTLLKAPQLIALTSFASSDGRFKGQATQVTSGFTQTGSSSSHTSYYLPSFYIGIPFKDKFSFGIAAISNFFNRNIEENAILRYAQSSNRIQNIDLVPALGVKINDFFSLGIGANFSYANFLLKPISGFPSLNIPDAESRNEANSNGLGGELGVLLKPGKSTVVGFNYRTAVTYRFRGDSIFNSNPPVISNHYAFNFWTPARSILSINQFITPSFGIIGTIQRIEWSIFKNINIEGIAAKAGSFPIIVNATVPYKLRNTWLFTAGSHYRITPKCVVRSAVNYNQTPGNGNFQISTGDSITLGASIGYELFKNISIDGSYAHVFHQNQPINIRTGRNFIQGNNKALRDAISLKLTLTL